MELYLKIISTLICIVAFTALQVVFNVVTNKEGFKFSTYTYSDWFFQLMYWLMTLLIAYLVFTYV